MILFLLSGVKMLEAEGRIELPYTALQAVSVFADQWVIVLPLVLPLLLPNCSTVVTPSPTSVSR